MPEFYRIRSTERLLGESRELDQQTLYFASPEELNDPMEGFRDLVWRGDRIAWTNLFKHYASCLHWVYFYARIAGSTALTPDMIPVTTGWRSSPTPQFTALFNNVWHAIRDELQVPIIVEKLVGLDREARRNELLFYLHSLHLRAIAIIRRVHAEHHLEPESHQVPELTGESLLTSSALFDLLQEAEGEADFSRRLFLVWNQVQDERIFEHGADFVAGDVSPDSRRALFLDFPRDYVDGLEKLLWPKWYAACFSKDYGNSSLWGTYGKGHRGVCLIFATGDGSDSRTMHLEDSSGSPRHVEFHDVAYHDRRNAVNFFRNIGRLPPDAAMELWYKDDAGSTSECASHLLSDDTGTWRDEYWTRFYQDITSKTKHWEHEHESRLILHGLLENELASDERCLTYGFESLAGVIFGIRTSDEDKLRIIDIIRRKCSESSRQGFQFFQAFYSPEHGEIRSHALSIDVGGTADRQD